jgi:hypothetical protein
MAMSDEPVAIEPELTKGDLAVLKAVPDGAKGTAMTIWHLAEARKLQPSGFHEFALTLSGLVHLGYVGKLHSFKRGDVYWRMQKGLEATRESIG